MLQSLRFCSRHDHSSSEVPVSDPFHGVFRIEHVQAGRAQLSRHPSPPAAIPDPQSGRLLSIATVDARTRAICPSCSATAHGGFVSFVQDLRLAYACPSCLQLVWLPGA
jgi:hypothetical protein